MPDVEIQEAETRTAAPASDKSLRGVSLGKVGRASQKRQNAVLQLARRLQHETRVDRTSGRVVGPNQPCTLVNFNPIDLVVEMEGRRIMIPAAGRFEAQRVSLDHAGRRIDGHYMVVDKPILYTTVTGHETDSLLPIDVPVSAAHYFSPHAIGCAIYDQYNSANNKIMGGLLFFDQDVRQLEHLDRWQGRIWVPERTQIEDSPEFVYSLRETLLEEELDRLFTVQRTYCDIIIQQAHALWAEQDVTSRKMVTDTHREWARYAVKMFWMKELPEWVTHKLSASGPMTDLVKCRYCGSQQLSPDVLFCKACNNNAPFDVYKAFKWRGPNGERVVVPEMYLETLEGEQLEEVLAELAERATKRARFEALAGGSSSAAPAKQLFGAAKAAAERKAEREAAEKAAE